MLASEEVEINLVSKVIKHYEELGYNIPRKQYKNTFIARVPNGTRIKVKIKDLPIGSHVKIHVKCDFCNKDIYPEYSNYLRDKENNNIDVCYSCRTKKQEILTKIKNDSNKNTNQDKGYWNSMDNVIKEFNNYYNKYKTFSNIQKVKEGLAIINALARHKTNYTKLALELGYSIQELGHVPYGWYDDFEVLKLDIIKLINLIKRFPTVLEIQKNLKIGSLVICKHGGMQSIRNRIEYDDSSDLLDGNGYYNASSYEYMTSQFLIHNTNIEYERDVIISAIEGRYNCDFRAKLLNGDYIWIEVWGGLRGGFFNTYEEAFKIKKELYKKHNLTLISLYPTDFDKKTYNEVQERLFEIFKPFIDLKYEKIDIKLISCYKNISDNEMLKELMAYSEDGFHLPTDTSMQIANSKLYFEVYKRYGNFGKFAEIMGLTLHLENKPMNYWSENKIFDFFDYMINNYGKILQRNETDKHNDDYLKFNGTILSGLKKYGGKQSIKIKYFKECIKTNKLIPIEEVKWLKNVVNNKGTGIKNKVTPLQQQLAQQILTKIVSNT